MPSSCGVLQGLLRAALAACAFLAWGCAGPPKTTLARQAVPYEVAAWQYLDQPGQRITSEHYEICTTLDEQVLVGALPQALETAYRFYRELVPTAREPQQPMRVYLFARRGEWAHFTRGLAGRRATTLLKVRQGGYMERGVSVAEYVAHSVTFPLLTHEGLHQYMYHCVRRRVPAWLNEGLAVLCEGQRWDDSGLKEFDPRLNPLRRNALAETLLRGETFPLDELLRINAGHVVGASTRRVSAYYAQLWALMLFLREGEEGKYAGDFELLLNALGSQNLEPILRAAHARSAHGTYDYGRALFFNFISDDLETVQREYDAFMRREILSER